MPDDPPRPHKILPPEWRWGVTLVLICAGLSAVMRVSIDSFAIFLLPLSAEFGWGRTEAVSIYSLTMLCFGVGSLAAGRLIDRIGPRWTYSGGLALIAAAFLLAPGFSSLTEFALAMGVVVGIGSALIGMVSHGVLLATWFTDNLTLAISLTFSASGFGMMVAAPLLQVLVINVGWQDSYFQLGNIAAVLALLLPLLPWARLRARDPHARVTRPAGVRREREKWQHILRDPNLLALFIIQFLTAVSMFALNAQIVAFLIDQGFAPVRAAAAFGMAGLAGTIGVVVFGWIADRRGRQTAMSLSYAMSVLGFSLLFAVIAWPVWWLVGAFVLIYGPTFGSRGPIVTAMVPNLVGRGYGLGFKIGFVQMGFGVGAAVGALSGGWLHDKTGYEGVIGLAMAAGIAALALYWSVTGVRRA